MMNVNYAIHDHYLDSIAVTVESRFPTFNLAYETALAEFDQI